MSRSVCRFQQGLDYQARFFWRHAAVRLLKPAMPIDCVGFETNDADTFDNVVFGWSAQDHDQFGCSILRDYYQIRFHVDHDGGGIPDSQNIAPR